MYLVDERWHGRFGIGRFAQEVGRRLPAEFRPAGFGGSPSSPRDAVNPARMRLRRGDVLYSPGFNAGISAATQVLTVHDLIHLEQPGERSAAKSAYYRLVVRRAALRAGTVLTVSGASRVALRDWLAPHDPDVRVVGNGVSADFAPRPGAMRVPGRFCFVGNLKPHKNLPVVLAALRHRPRYRLVMVTDDVAAARALARGHGVAEQIDVRPDVPDADLAEIYRTATALVLPSRREGFGLPGLEATACGTRVVHWAGCAAVAEHVGGRGLAVSSADAPDPWVDALDEAVARVDVPVATTPAWRARHDWDAVAAAVQAAVRSAAPAAVTGAGP